MNDSISRREFISHTAAVGAGLTILSMAGHSATAQAKTTFPKAVIWGMLPKDLSDEDKIKLAKSCGFDGIEMPPLPADDHAKELAGLAKKHGVKMHSVIFGGWHAPLSHPDPAKVDEGKAGVETALRLANILGADNILLVPAVVNEEVRYADAYERSQKHIRELLPLAKELNVIIAVENVWNEFLLSPLEFAKYVDEFNDPFLQAYFDVGNVVAFGYPQDWIRTLGKRIVKVHLKDFKKQEREWVNLGEGSVNWPEVRNAFAEIGFTGFCTAELANGDEPYHRDLAARIDKLLA
ncbi:MAG: sugar phosphate isomerase/epimerase family protein [Candidatus Hydrogenedentes bacterium]|nr:sugar phosphate isomerase/epimerase family protein [Candidatus Hydrogenedentota bacterium]